MTLDNIVVSLELAKELKENGYPQDTVFAWSERLKGTGHTWDPYDGTGKYEVIPNTSSEHPLDHKYAAPTASEIGGQLPEYVSDDWFLEMYKDRSNSKDEEWYLVRYVDNDGIGSTEIKVGFNEPCEANARAKMWLYLKRNRLLKEESPQT
jgi:hypothetical protein